MQITRSKNSDGSTKLVVSANASDLEPIKKHVVGHHFAEVKVPGFRAGKAPAHLIEQHIDQKRLLDEVTEHAVNEFYRRAIEQEGLRPLGQPQIELKKFVPFTELEFEASQSTLGEIKLADYKKVKLAKPKVEVGATEVNQVIKNLQAKLAKREPVKRATKLGDEVVIDFAGTDEKGEPVSGAESKDFPLTLGSETFILGFEDNLVGLKAGDKKQFKITFPADYNVPALQSKKVTFDVSVNKVNELAEPRLDDALAAQAGPFESVAELKADIKKQLTTERQLQAERDYESQLIAKITEKSQLDVPTALVDQQIQRAEEEEKRNLVYRGQTWQEHLKAEGITEEQHRERGRPEAQVRVKAGLVLSEIADKEQIQVTPAEIDQRIEELKTQYQDPAMLTELDKPENRQDIGARILTEKTITRLVGYASS